MTFQDKYMQKDPSWRIEEDTAATGKRKLHESLFTLSNGYVGMRGINEDMPAGSCPGTFIAGGYDQSECMCVEMVNFPNALPLHLVIDDKKLGVDTVEVKKMYGERIIEEVTVRVTEGQPLHITKYIAIR